MSQEIPDDLEFRILALLDGTLEEKEVARLDAELRGSREARDRYQQLALLHIALEEQATARSGLAHVPVIPIELLLARQRQRVVKASLMVAAAVTLLFALVFHFKAVQNRQPLADFRLGPDSAFTLTHAGDGEKAPPGKVLGKGSRLHLTQGTLEVEFDSGVRCVIEAPGKLHVVDRERVVVTEGVAWFEVPAKAVGFTVETPRFTAVDLGTEFGVILRADGAQELHVTQGAVEMQDTTTGKSAQRLVLNAGQARRVDAGGGWQEIPAEASRFTTVLPRAVYVVNHSFEEDRNPSPDGVFAAGERGDFGGELTGWISQSGQPTFVHVGWRDIAADQLDPFPPAPDRPAQTLSLISSASVLNQTSTPWSSLRVGDKLTLTISMGLRAGEPRLTWNEKTFFGLTDGSFSPKDVPETGDTVAHSGLITQNPATGNRSGNGRFVDVSLEHIVQPADLLRPGQLGILIVGDHPQRADTDFQSCFDNVRLRISPGSTPQAPGE